MISIFAIYTHCAEYKIENETGNLTLNKGDKISASNASDKTLFLLFNDQIESKLDVTIDGITHKATNYEKNINYAVRLAGGSTYSASYYGNDQIQVVYWLISSTICPSASPAYTTVSRQNSTYYVTPIVLQPPNVSQFDSMCVFSLAQDESVASFHQEGNVNGQTKMYIGDTSNPVSVSKDTEYNIGFSALITYDGVPKVGTFSMATTALNCSTFVTEKTKNSHIFLYTKDSANKVIIDNASVHQGMSSKCSSSSSSSTSNVTFNITGLIITIVVVVLIICGCIGGFIWYRKRKSGTVLSYTDTLIDHNMT